MGSTPIKTHVARDTEATACDHQKVGYVPQEGRTLIQTALGRQSASGDKKTDNPAPLHTRVARGTHFEQGCVSTCHVMREVTKLIPEEDLW